MTKREKWLLCCGIALAAIAICRFAFSRSSETARRPGIVPQQFNADVFQPQRVVKTFPAIVNPPHVTAGEAKDRLQPTTLVLGVQLDGLSRAYPINMLNGPTREIFNDTLGQRHIAATW